MRHKYQGIPKNGYAKFMKDIIDGIPVILNFDYLKNRDSFSFKKMLIFTGPIDEFFGFDIGKLKYRGQRRENKYLTDVEYFQPYGQVNNPDPFNRWSY